MPDHPNFEYWKLNDTQPFPVSEITLSTSGESITSASADITIPNAQPTAATVAERSIGVAGDAKLWFGLECTTQLNGKVTCEGVMHARHLHWWAEHNESGPGPEQEIRLTAADLKGGGRKEAIAAHGPHCDLFSAMWYQHNGKVGVTLTVTHWAMTPDDFVEYRKKAAKEAERWPKERRPYIPVDPDPKPTPPPKPDG